MLLFGAADAPRNLEPIAQNLAWQRALPPEPISSRTALACRVTMPTYVHPRCAPVSMEIASASCTPYHPPSPDPRQECESRGGVYISKNETCFIAPQSDDVLGQNVLPALDWSRYCGKWCHVASTWPEGPAGPISIAPRPGSPRVAEVTLRAGSGHPVACGSSPPARPSRPLFSSALRVRACPGRATGGRRSPVGRSARRRRPGWRARSGGASPGGPEACRPQAVGAPASTDVQNRQKSSKDCQKGTNHVRTTAQLACDSAHRVPRLIDRRRASNTASGSIT